MANTQVKFQDFEDEIRSAMAVTDDDVEFIKSLRSQVLTHSVKQPGSRPAAKSPLFAKIRAGWVVAFAVIFLLVISILAIGPQRVYAEVARWLGYLPEVGLVDKNSSIRVLAEPVSITRDGVTMSITSATLTSDKSVLNYGASGVPLSAYPVGENTAGGCIENDYFLLPDGSKLAVANEMGPIPADVNQVTLIIPCIANTLPGTVPTDWELPIRFVPAPPDMTIIPVIQIQATALPSPQADSPTAAENPLAITQVLDIGDHYVIMGEFRYDALGKKAKLAHDNVFSDGSWVVVKDVKIIDAVGQETSVAPSDGIDSTLMAIVPTPSRPDAAQWNYQADKIFVPPLTIEYNVEDITPVGAAVQAEFEFDAGPDPQNGEEWDVKKDFTLGGYAIHLDSITFSSNFGYEFRFTVDHGASANAISVDLPGYTQNCGGGSGGDDFPDSFTETFCVTKPGAGKFPTGKLTATLNFQTLKRTDKTYQVQWNPDSSQTQLFSTPTAQPGLCLSRSNFPQILPVPASLTGKVLLTEPQENGQSTNLTLFNLNGSQPQVLLPQGGSGALSPDGKELAYATSAGIVVQDIATGKSVVVSSVSPKGVVEGNLFWSPDGQQIAYVGAGDAKADGIFLVSSDGTSQRQLSNLGYESIAGWSPDGQKLYYAIPGLILKEIDVSSGLSQDLFELTDSSPKYPNPVESPDGNWIAYIGSAGLYEMRMDGTKGHLLIDHRLLDYSIGGFSRIAWSPKSDWLAVNMTNSQESENGVLLLNPVTCEAYRLSGVSGVVDGLMLP
jgi:hypothetical protein